MTSYENFIVDFGFGIQKDPPCTKFKQDQANILVNMQVSSFSIPRHIHNKRLPWQHLKLMRIFIVCKMPHGSKIKLEKFHFDILCCFGVIKESLPGGGDGIRPFAPGEIGLKSYLSNPS